MIKKIVRCTFEISEDAYDLLLKISKEAAEYRDPEFKTLEEFRKANAENAEPFRRTDEWFLNRNTNGTYYLIEELERCGLVQDDDRAWHMSYGISPFGKEILQNKKFRHE